MIILFVSWFYLFWMTSSHHLLLWLKSVLSLVGVLLLHYGREHVLVIQVEIYSKPSRHHSEKPNPHFVDWNPWLRGNTPSVFTESLVLDVDWLVEVAPMFGHVPGIEGITSFLWHIRQLRVVAPTESVILVRLVVGRMQVVFTGGLLVLLRRLWRLAWSLEVLVPVWKWTAIKNVF